MGPVVVLNERAGGGRAAARWRKVATAVAVRTGPFAATVATTPGAARDEIGRWADRGVTKFVAAGGDGTVNLVISALAERGLLESCALGAVGLGSSNDFHKPVSPAARIEGLPVRVDFAATVPHDVCTLDYDDPAGTSHRGFWIINASLGTTAEANAFFNLPDRLLGFLKRALPSLALVYAAGHTLLVYRGTTLALTTDQGSQQTVRIRNLGIVKNPHFSGMLHYDSPHEPASGEFWVHLLEPLPALSLLATLAGLTKGRFRGRRGTRSWPARSLEARAEEPVAFTVETDGEVVPARRAVFAVHPRRLRVCS